MRSGRRAGGLLREAEHRKRGQVGIHYVFLIGMKHWRQLSEASEDRDNLSWSFFPPLPDPLKIDNLSLLVMLIFSPSWKVGKKYTMLPLCARQDTNHLPFILLTSGQSLITPVLLPFLREVNGFEDPSLFFTEQYWCLQEGESTVWECGEVWQ